MNNFTSNTTTTINKTNIVKGLINAAIALRDNGLPSHVWEDEGEVNEYTGIVPQRESWHWTATKIEIEGLLGRKLDREELTVLSLSRAFGPMPTLEEVPELEESLINYLWPEGDSFGSGYYWNEFVVELEFYLLTMWADKTTVSKQAKTEACYIVGGHSDTTTWEPVIALNNVARRYQRAERVDLAVHFAKALYKELMEQTLDLAQKMQSPAWGHLLKMFQEPGTRYRGTKQNHLSHLKKGGTLPEHLYLAASAAIRAKTEYKNFCNEQGVIEHLQDL